MIHQAEVPGLEDIVIRDAMSQDHTVTQDLEDGIMILPMITGDQGLKEEKMNIRNLLKQKEGEMILPQ